MTVILTGIKPTGRPHIGNLVGMIAPTLKLIDANRESRNVLFIANYHALNSAKDGSSVRDCTYDIAATLLACGLDPSRTVMYRQSDVPQTFEFATILAAVTPKGLMNRAHAYKAAVERNRRECADDVDIGVNMGLYTYPILMAADILLYDTDVVPVGKDQVQHVEFARDIAGSFNAKYGQVLTLPRHAVQPDAAAIPGLDGRKMSKSYGNTIAVFDTPEATARAVRRIVTDSTRPEEPKDPASSAIFQIYAALADPAETEAFRARFLAGGLGYGEAKRVLADKINDVCQPLRPHYDALMADRARLDEILDAGAERAREMAGGVMDRVRRAVGR